MNAAKFFTALKPMFGGTYSQSEVDGINTILTACEGLSEPRIAYALATVYHETAKTMLPIKEYGGDEYFMRYDITVNKKLALQLGNTREGDGVKYAGRGYVMITGRRNYQLAGDKLGINLIDNPDLAMDKDIAAKILRKGMDDGWFTGSRFSDYIFIKKGAEVNDFKGARRIINGRDKADLIAGYAVKFLAALRA